MLARPYLVLNCSFAATRKQWSACTRCGAYQHRSAAALEGLPATFQAEGRGLVNVGPFAPAHGVAVADSAQAA